MDAFRKNVGLCIFNKEGKILLARRADLPEDAFYPWQMPQGGIDENETVAKAGLRELKEELDLDKVKIIAESKEWIPYTFPKDIPPVVDIKTGVKYIGQNQKWLLIELIGEDKDIRLDAFPEEIEFIDWGWFDIKEAPELAVQFKKETYQKVLKEFEPIIKKEIKK